MEVNSLALIEAILFLENEAIDIRTLAKISQLEKEEVEDALKKLKERLSDDSFGMDLLCFDGLWKLYPKKIFEPQLVSHYGKKTDSKLSRASIETLSIIAYSQPITRAEIDAIRGVSSDAVLRQLSTRNLIHEVGKKEAPGRPSQYGTTRDFLRVFNIKSLAELPKLDELEKKRFEYD